MCIPQNLSSLVVYYNRNLFIEAGLAEPSANWNWDDLLKAALALTRDTDGDGAVDQYGFGTSVSLQRVAPFIWQNAGELAFPPGNPQKLALDTTAAREAIQWFVDLQVRHRVAPDAVSEKAESSENRFINGRLAMYLNSRRGVPTYRQISAFDWDVAALPQRRSAAGILHSDAYCMAATTRDKAAAWRFIEFANSLEGQTLVARSGRTVPSLRAVAESPAFLDPQLPPRNSRVFLDTLPVMRSVPIMRSWEDIEEVASAELERAYYGNASVDEVIQAAIIRSREYFTR